jgi:hypothetical protein
MSARILILSYSRIEADARVLKQVQLLAPRYEVETCGYGEPPEGVVAHHRVPDDRRAWQWPKVSTVLRQFRRAYHENPALSWTMQNVPAGRYDVIVANDIESVGVALALKPRRGVHADLHEYAPRQRENLPRWRWFVAPIVRWMCRTHLPKAASVTTVSPLIGAEYQRRFGVHPDIVRNLAPYADAEPRPVSTPLRLVHSGGALRGRGIDLVCDAAEATRSDVTLDLYLTAADPGYLAELRARAEASDRITLNPPVPYRLLNETLNGYDVGIHVLPPENLNHLWALPNKLFDYIQARLGVIVGPSPEMARVVRETGVGAITEGFASADLVAVLDTLTNQQVAEWKAASQAHARALSSETEVGIWLAAIEAILAGDPSPQSTQR